MKRFGERNSFELSVTICCGVLFVLVCAALVIASRAGAQTPMPHPDVPLAKIGGVYNIGCVTPIDIDLVTVCWVRSDLPGGEIALGCMPGPEPITEYRMDVSVSNTPFIDAAIRCYVIDDDGLESDRSENAGIVDFTPPGRGRIK